MVNGMIMDHTKEQGILQFLFRASKEVFMNIGEMTDENHIQDKYTLYVRYYESCQKELDKLNATQEEWKLRAMGTTIGCHTIVKKGTEGNDIKTYDLT